MEDKPCKECGYNELNNSFCNVCFTVRSSINWKSKDEVIKELYQKIIELEKANKKYQLDKLKSDKQLIEMYCKYGDCADDYFNDIDAINKQIQHLENEE